MPIEEQLHATIQRLETAAGLAVRNEEICKRLFEVAEIQGLVADSGERVRHMEANLDARIRIITTEHSNGKGKL
jgi:hypothetical protein